jgi:hypothetical protein
LHVTAAVTLLRPEFDPWSIHVVFVVGKLALGQVFLRVFRDFPVNFITPVLHYFEKVKKLIIFLFFITELHNKLQGCGASVASAAGPFSTKKKKHSSQLTRYSYPS